jgi:hypothetical protein
MVYTMTWRTKVAAATFAIEGIIQWKRAQDSAFLFEDVNKNPTRLRFYKVCQSVSIGTVIATSAA